MSKAEERALEAYPSTSHYWNAEPDRNTEAREFYIQGYHQAEKDKELTWRDMAEIVEIANLLATEWLSKYTMGWNKRLGILSRSIKTI